MNDFIPVNEPLLLGNEKKYLNECIDTGWVSSDGPFVERFEKDFAKKIGRKYAISVTSGTTALEASCMALGFGKGDEIIMPTFTIISCATAIIKSGAKPVLVDCSNTDWNMLPKEIEKKITLKTKAILVVHIYGLPCDMDEILRIAKKFNLKIIEDSAEMLGQTYKGQNCGTFGEVSTFSFYANKHITTGEGGMILTDDYDIAEKCRSLRNLCFQPEKRFIHEEMGFNFRMTNIQAALGLAQLEQLDYFIKKKKEMGRVYNELLSNLANLIQIPIASNSCASNIYWVYGIVLKSKDYSATKVIAKLKKEGIGTRPFFYPMHNQPVFKKKGLFIGESYRNSEIISKQGLYLPSGMKLSNDQIYKVAKKLKNILIK